MKKVIDRIRPDLIHLNTVIRPPSEKWVVPLNQKEMEEIKAFFGEKTSIISEFDRHPLSILESDVKEEILKILRRRPLSLADLSKGMGIPQNELDRFVEPVTQEGIIRPRSFGNSVYYDFK